jgi:hypothetical protein
MGRYTKIYNLIVEVGNPDLKRSDNPGKDLRTTVQAKQQAVLKKAIRTGNEGTAENITKQLDKARETRTRRFYPNQR